MKLEFQPAARQELASAMQWYLDDGGVQVAEQFEHALDRAVQLLTQLPKIGTPGAHDTRHWPLKRFPYTLVYRVRGKLISVVAVAHQSRAPSYWQGR